MDEARDTIIDYMRTRIQNLESYIDKLKEEMEELRLTNYDQAYLIALYRGIAPMREVEVIVSDRLN